MIYTIPTKIVGVTFKNEDGSDRQELIKNLKTGDDLSIESEPDNRYDPNSHVIKHNGKILGHIKRELAEKFVHKVKNGEKIVCIEDWNVTGGDKHTFGVNIIVKLDDGVQKND